MSPSDPPFRNRTLVFLVFFVLLGASGGFGVAAFVTDGDLRKILWTGAVTLIFGALLGGVVQLLFADFNRRRLTRAEEAQFITHVLNDLKAVYDRVERARVLISAHQSALTYGSEMRDLIEARVKLLTVLRALAKDPRSHWIAGVNACVADMDRYLEGVVVEFQKKYKEIADRQKLHEARIAAHLKALESASTLDSVVTLNEPWQLLCRLPELNDLLESRPHGSKEESRYRSQFVDSLDRASRELREALVRTLS